MFTNRNRERGGKGQGPFHEFKARLLIADEKASATTLPEHKTNMRKVTKEEKSRAPANEGKEKEFRRTAKHQSITKKRSNQKTTSR